MTNCRRNLVAVALCVTVTHAWSPAAPAAHHRTLSPPNHFAASQLTPTPHKKQHPSFSTKLHSENETKELIQDNTPTESTAVYGVSYIGGDPCGSKYNDDPFDASKESSKPGLPDDMKDRIAALAARKLQEQKEKDNEQ